MTRKFKVGDRVQFKTSLGYFEDHTILAFCVAPLVRCYISTGGKHMSEDRLTLAVTPQNLDALSKAVDSALDRLEAVEGRVDKLEQAGGRDLVGDIAAGVIALQNPTPKFKVGDRVKVTADNFYQGVEATVGRLKYGAFDYGLLFDGETATERFWGYNESELELAPEREPQVGDVVEIVWDASVYKGRVCTVVGTSHGSSLLLYIVEVDGRKFGYKKGELIVLRTAEEDAKLKADAKEALERRAQIALNKLSYAEEIDVRNYLKGESK